MKPIAQNKLPNVPKLKSTNFKSWTIHEIEHDHKTWIKQANIPNIELPSTAAYFNENGIVIPAADLETYDEITSLIQYGIFLLYSFA